MPQYQRTAAIAAHADEVFSVISDVSNLPAILPLLTEAHADPGGHVRAVLHVSGERREIHGRLRVDARNRRIEWSSERGPGYRGFLQVRTGDTSPGLCELDMHLSIDAPAGLIGEQEPSWFDEWVQGQMMVLFENITRSLRHRRRVA